MKHTPGERGTWYTPVRVRFRTAECARAQRVLCVTIPQWMVVFVPGYQCTCHSFIGTWSQSHFYVQCRHMMHTTTDAEQSWAQIAREASEGRSAIAQRIPTYIPRLATNANMSMDTWSQSRFRTQRSHMTHTTTDAEPLLGEGSDRAKVVETAPRSSRWPRCLEAICRRCFDACSIRTHLRLYRSAGVGSRVEIYTPRNLMSSARFGTHPVRCVLRNARLHFARGVRGFVSQKKCRSVLARARTMSLHREDKTSSLPSLNDTCPLARSPRTH